MRLTTKLHTLFVGPAYCRGVLKLDVISAFMEGHRRCALANIVQTPCLADTAPLTRATLSPEWGHCRH
jgi:hypothetical protein